MGEQIGADSSKSKAATKPVATKPFTGTSCSSCQRRLETGQTVVAEPINNGGLLLDDVIRRGNYRFYHEKCIRKVKRLASLPKIEWVNYAQERQDRKEIKL